MIRELKEKETKQIYQEQMLYDFPADERKPMELIERLMREGRYQVFGSYEGDRLEAYAFLIHEKDSAVYLLDYFAVCRDGRGQGTGSRFLREVFKLLEGDLLLLEVEDVERAANEADRVMRSRRMDFYHRNGVRDTELATVQFGVDLVILYLSRNAAEPDINRRAYEALDNIYRFVFGSKYGDGTVMWREDAVR